MIKFTNALIASTLLLVTSQVAAKVSVEVEKATQVNTQDLVTSATDYLNSSLSQPLFKADSLVLTAQNTLVTPIQSATNDNVVVSTDIEAE